MTGAIFFPPDRIAAGLADGAEAGSRAFGATWDALRPFTRGYAFEDWYASLLGSSWRRLAPAFRTFDFYQEASGTALSLKSMDLSLGSYATYEGIYSKVTKYIDSAASFSGSIRRGGFVLRSAQIQERVLTIVYPDMELSYEQYRAMYHSYIYGQSAGVEVEWLMAR